MFELVAGHDALVAVHHGVHRADRWSLQSVLEAGYWPRRRRHRCTERRARHSFPGIRGGRSSGSEKITPLYNKSILCQCSAEFSDRAVQYVAHLLFIF